MHFIILAAGKSKRMKQDKAFLKIDGEYFISSIIKKLKSFSDNITIIAGKHNIKRIKKLFSNINVIPNYNYHLGQINSVKVAVKYMIENKMKEPLMINLVDQPLIKKSTYKKIIEAQKKNKNKAIIIPYTIKKDGFKKRGHPIIIQQKYFNLINKAPYDKGLHWVTHHKKSKIKEVFVKDTGIIKDFDTYAEYVKEFK